VVVGLGALLAEIPLFEAIILFDDNASDGGGTRGATWKIWAVCYVSRQYISISIGLLGPNVILFRQTISNRVRKKIRETERTVSGTGLLLYRSVGIFPA
jgi:hypothetical protein